MRCTMFVAALFCGLIIFVSPVSAHKAHRIKMVPTTIGVIITDQSGKALQSSDGTVELVLKQFGKHEWLPEYWATMVLHSESNDKYVSDEEHFLLTRFPIDSVAVHRMTWIPGFITHHAMTIAFQVLDSHGHPFQRENGVRITLTQIGEQRWPTNVKVVIHGIPDSQGNLLVIVDVPFDKTIVNNFLLMAKSPAP